MKHFLSLIFLLLFSLPSFSQQKLKDNFKITYSISPENETPESHMTFNNSSISLAVKGNKNAVNLHMFDGLMNTQICTSGERDFAMLINALGEKYHIEPTEEEILAETEKDTELLSFSYDKKDIKKI